MLAVNVFGNILLPMENSLPFDSAYISQTVSFFLISAVLDKHLRLEIREITNRYHLATSFRR